MTISAWLLPLPTSDNYAAAASDSHFCSPRRGRLSHSASTSASTPALIDWCARSGIR